MKPSVKTRRLELRLTDEERDLEEAAAAAMGVSLSEFVRQAARVRAQEILRERDKLELSDEAAVRFLSALDTDTPPPAAMRELLARPAPWQQR